MIRFTVFPRLRILPHQKANPYIRDFVAALEQKMYPKWSIRHTRIHCSACCLPNGGEMYLYLTGSKVFPISNTDHCSLLWQSASSYC